MIKVGGISAYWFTGGIIVESDQTNVFCLFKNRDTYIMMLYTATVDAYG